MGETTNISWTDASFNPWWGCRKISAGCKNCYAEIIANRMGAPGLWGQSGLRRLFGTKHWSEPVKWDIEATRAGVRRRVFCGSMCDVFEDGRPIGELERLQDLILRTSNLDWQLLTKRPATALFHPEFELPNVWMGTTVEDRASIGRLDSLRKINVPVRFVSCEPLLEDLGDLNLVGIHWVIVGCESGPRARPMRADWVRRIRDQSLAAGAAFFFKQANFTGRLDQEPTVDGRLWRQFPKIPGGRG